jgi:hypothetical protein
MVNVFNIQVCRSEKRRHEKELQLVLPCSVFVSADGSWRTGVFCYKFVLLITATACIAELKEQLSSWATAISLSYSDTSQSSTDFCWATAISLSYSNTSLSSGYLCWATAVYTCARRRGINALPPSSYTNKRFLKNYIAKDLSSIMRVSWRPVEERMKSLVTSFIESSVNKGNETLYKVPYYSNLTVCPAIVNNTRIDL